MFFWKKEKNIPPPLVSNDFAAWPLGDLTQYHFSIFCEKDRGRGLWHAKTFANQREASDLLFHIIADGQPKERIPALLGVNKSGKISWFDIAEKNTLVAGQTRSGKTNWIKSAILSLLHFSHPEYLKLIVLDPKAAAFKKLENVCNVYTDPQSIVSCLQQLNAILDTRIAETAKPSNPSDAKGFLTHAYKFKKRSMLMPQILVIFDEFADFICKNKEIESTIHRLVSLGLGLGIAFVFATQAPYKEYIRGVVKNNFENRVCFSVGDAVHENIVLGKQQKGKEERATSLDTGKFLRREKGSRVFYNAVLVEDEELATATKNWKEGKYDFKLFS